MTYNKFGREEESQDEWSLPSIKLSYSIPNSSENVKNFFHHTEVVPCEKKGREKKLAFLLQLVYIPTDSRSREDG